MRERLDEACNRNYGVYGVLSLGTPLHEAIEQKRKAFLVVQPVAAARGLPHDASASVRQAFAEYGADALDPSWALLREILAYEWDQEIRWMRSFACAEDVEAGYVYACDEVFPNGQSARYYVSPAGTGYTARKAGSCVLDVLVPKLHTFGGPDDVRIVFWYF